MSDDEAVRPRPQDPPHRAATAAARAPSLVLVNTGDGKGKSTAAFGVGAARGVARGWPVAVVQFLKSGEVAGRRGGRRTALGVDWYVDRRGLHVGLGGPDAGRGGRARRPGHHGPSAHRGAASTGSSCSTRSPTR